VAYEVEGELGKAKRLQEIRHIYSSTAHNFFTFEGGYEWIILTVKLTRFRITKSERMALSKNVIKAVLKKNLL